MIAATFSRASAAYKQDGSQVANNVPRYEAGKSGQAIMIEEGTTNLCPSAMAMATDWSQFFYDPSVSLSEVAGNKVHVQTTGAAAEGFYTAGVTVSPNTVYSASVKLSREGYPQFDTPVNITFRSYTSGLVAINSVVVPNVSLTTTPKTIRVAGLNSGASAAFVRIIVRSASAAAINVWGSDFQVESKVDASSFINGTRSNEVLEIPLAAWKKEPPFAIECRFWYDPTRVNPTDGRRVFSCTESGGFCLAIASSSFVSDLSAWVHTGGAYQIPKTPLANLVTGWNDVALVVLPTAVQLWLNGVLRDQKTGVFNSIQWPAPAALKFFVGAENANGVAATNFLNALVDEIVFLDAAETVAKYT